MHGVIIVIKFFVSPRHGVQLAAMDHFPVSATYDRGDEIIVVILVSIPIQA